MEQLLKPNSTELAKLAEIESFFWYSLGEKNPTLPRKLTYWWKSFPFLKEESLILGACA